MRVFIMPAGLVSKKPHSQWGFLFETNGFIMKQTTRKGCFRLKLSTVIEIILMLVLLLSQ
ncbi:hypothetical protein BG910_06160 [Neisseria chenwenguii]|uniref:Uncharacterized protein n=1 Tax=Neisseria chenwenguii TaxID=1853278 RepID=A0A220S1Q5_9NEIS|nr:hypothetical protein BG910_06160 [Neisseria chenwenguii]